MTHSFTSLIRIAAIATLTTTIAATGALAADSAADRGAMLKTIHAKQAVTRAEVNILANNLRAIHQQDHLDVIAAKQAATRAEVNILANNLRAIHQQDHLDAIAAKQAANRAELTALVGRAREMGVNPQLAAR